MKRGLRAARAITGRLGHLALFIAVGFAVTTALHSQTRQSSANTNATESVQKSEQAEDSTGEEQTEAISARNERQSDQTPDSHETESSHDIHESNTNSIKLEITSSSSSAGTAEDLPEDTESQAEVVINGQTYDLPSNGRIKERIKQETETTETDTKIKVDVDGGDNTSIRINGG